MESHKGLLKKVKVYGLSGSSEAYVIRDFLKRTVVTYEWIPVDSGVPAGIFEQGSAALQFPVVELPCGTFLYNPTVADIANNLGWVTQPKHKEYDISIFGGGPAGLSAAVYAASEGLKTVLVEKEAVGGQAGTSSLIENYLGFPGGISGSDLAERARQQAVKFGVEILLLRKGMHTHFADNKIHVELVDNSRIIARSNICATGVHYRKLEIPDEGRFLNRGIYYGAGSSEAYLCADKHIFVVGGGNSAGQAVLNFSKHAHKVSMVIRGGDLSSTLSWYLLQRILKKKNVEVIFNARITGLKGDHSLEEIELTDTITQKTSTCATGFVFACIGGIPNTDWAKDTDILRDPFGYLITGADLFREGRPAFWKPDRSPSFLETSIPGCFAAGDVRHNSVKRVASAVGEGAMAVTLVHQFLQETYG